MTHYIESGYSEEQEKLGKNKNYLAGTGYFRRNLSVEQYDDPKGGSEILRIIIINWAKSLWGCL